MGSLLDRQEKMSGERIAILSCESPIEGSATVKGIASYLVDKGVVVDVLVGELPQENRLGTQHSRVVRLLPLWLVKAKRIWTRFVQVRVVGKLLGRVISEALQKVETYLVCKRLRREIWNDDLVYCVEMHALVLLSQIGYPLSRVVYFSIEGEQVAAEYGRDISRKLLGNCMFCVIHDKEREKGLSEYAGAALELEYLPVSLRRQGGGEEQVCPQHDTQFQSSAYKCGERDYNLDFYMDRVRARQIAQMGEKLVVNLFDSTFKHALRYFDYDTCSADRKPKELEWIREHMVFK